MRTDIAHISVLVRKFWRVRFFIYVRLIQIMNMQSHHKWNWRLLSTHELKFCTSKPKLPPYFFIEPPSPDCVLLGVSGAWWFITSLGCAVPRWTPCTLVLGIVLEIKKGTRVPTHWRAHPMGFYAVFFAVLFISTHLTPHKTESGIIWHLSAIGRGGRIESHLPRVGTKLRLLSYELRE